MTCVRGISSAFSWIVLAMAMLTSMWSCSCYLDRIVEDGEAYGFHVGDTRLDTYKKAKAVFSEDSVFVLYPVDKDGFGPHVKFAFDDSSYHMLADREEWIFYFDEGFFDFIRLRFDDGVVKSIYRHRNTFELP